MLQDQSRVRGVCALRAVLRGIQMAAVAAVVLGAAQVAMASGDGCNLDLRKRPGVTYEWGSCTPSYCNGSSRCQTMLVGGGWEVCWCPTGNPGWICKPAFLPDGGQVVIQLKACRTGSAACINWNCPTVPEGDDCPESWSPPGMGGEQVLTCPCPGT